MSDNTESYLNYQTYEYYIISKLNFDRVSDNLVNAGVMLEDEREKIGSIQGSRKQNISLVRFLFDERREFNPFLAVLGNDRSCENHREISRTIMARHNSKTEEQIEDEDRISHRTKSGSRYGERAMLERNESGSDSDSSSFTYETQSYSDINSPSGSDAERESDFEGSELERRIGTPRGVFNLPQEVQKRPCNMEVQKKGRMYTLLLLLFFLALAITTMPLKMGYKFSKFIVVK